MREASHAHSGREPERRPPISSSRPRRTRPTVSRLQSNPKRISRDVVGNVGFGEDVASGAIPVELAADFGDAPPIAVVGVGDASGCCQLALGVLGAGVGTLSRPSTLRVRHPSEIPEYVPCEEIDAADGHSKRFATRWWAKKCVKHMQTPAGNPGAGPRYPHPGHAEHAKL